jgi:hypothetical protein
VIVAAVDVDQLADHEAGGVGGQEDGVHLPGSVVRLPRIEYPGNAAPV